MSEPTPAPAPPQPEAEPRRIAWQPFTPRGIAAFGAATFGRLFTLQVIVAVMAAGAVVWFLSTVWFPIAREAIRNLPEEGAIRAHQLELPQVATERLVANRFLTFVIDLNPELPQTFSGDVFVVFRRGHYDICSLFGCVRLYYPADAPFSRLELEAKWGAWEPFLLGIAAIATALGVLFSWWILATVYFVWVWIFAFLADRELSFGGSWRLCGAGLLAGAVLLNAGIVGYGLGGLDLIRLLSVTAMHILLPWILIVWAVFLLPRIKPKGRPNPFANAPAKGAAGPQKH